MTSSMFVLVVVPMKECLCRCLLDMKLFICLVDNFCRLSM